MELWNKNVYIDLNWETTKFGDEVNNMLYVLLPVSDIKCNSCFD